MKKQDGYKLALGIETSCDETSVAIVDSNRRIHTNLIYSQYEEHRKHLGVVPEIAARSHLEKLPAMFDAALAEANLSMDDIDLIAATAGPGLIGGLHVGLQFAKGLAISTDKPIYAINHLEGHALTPRLVEEVAFPYLLLLVSGGHCQILLVKGVDQYDRWGTTLDDAAGEAFDKVAKMLALGYPGGPAVEKAAISGDPKAFEFSTPMAKNKSCDFSFSG
ncbi:MAG: tRNA (adenosine(37)-N6)-threonylcarbamoyltransferase complex transferase subunit TsaD, partial [Alphaproteobacteria bacterium]